MKPAAQMEWSRMAGVKRSAMVVTLLVLSVPVMAVRGQSPAPVSDARTTSAAPRLRAVHAVGLERQGVMLTLDVAGDYTYLPGNSGNHLLTVDLPGATTMEPTTSHLLESALVSSYRVVGYQRESQPFLRLEVLLKNAAAADYRRTEHGLEIRLTAAAGSASPAPAAAAPRMTTPVSAPVVGGPKASHLERVNLARSIDSTSVVVATNGSVEYKAFELHGPHRLVVDMPGVMTEPSNQPIRGSALVQLVRVGQFSKNPLVARVVVELDESARYEVKQGAKGLEIQVRQAGANQESAPAPVRKKDDVVVAAAALPSLSDTMPASSDAVFASVRQPAASPRNDGPVSAPAPAATAPALAAPAALATPAPGLMPRSTPMAVASPALARPNPVAGAVAPAQTLQSPPSKSGAGTIAALTGQSGAAVSGKRYTGEPISINVKGVDLLDFFRLIQEISGLNVIVDEGVRGQLTMVLTDVPWDQALDIVLHNYQLDAVLEGNVLRIASLKTLKEEQASILDLAASQRENQPQVTQVRSINYAKASQLTGVLTKFLTKCSGKPGSTCNSSITADERTNQLIITDYAFNFEPLDRMLAQLDRRTQQVEIEARVVAASRQFVRELGAQFGFDTLVGGRTLIGGNPVGQNTSPVLAPSAPVFSLGGNAIPLFSNFAAAGANVGLTVATQSHNFDLDLILTAAEQKGTGKLLSRPKIITQNNQAGKIQQGVQIPIQTTVNNTVTVIFQPVTLSMVVTPQITSDGTIFLDIDVTNSTIDPGIPRINGTPALDTQEANTKVMVQDGGTVVFGGVIQNQNNLTIQQVPLLGDIPIIGNFFKRTGISTTTSELIFFVTPKIL